MNPDSLRRLLPSAVTLTSVVSATAALLVLVMAPRSAARDVVVAACLAWSLLADRVDGLLARKLGVTSLTGAQLDSLADAIAFGVVPPLWLAARHDPFLPLVVAAVAYVVAAVVRLARFHSTGLVDGRFGPSFRGLPTPAAAGFVVVAIASDAIGRFEHAVVVEAGVAGLLAALMVAPFSYPKNGVGFVPLLVLVPASVVALVVVAAP